MSNSRLVLRTAARKPPAAPPGAAASPPRPVRVGASAPGPSLLQQRSNRLARGLDRICNGKISLAVIYVADPRSIDAQVAVAAAGKLGVHHLLRTVPNDEGEARRVAQGIAALRPTLVVACERGVRSLNDVWIKTRVVGDGEGVLWWRTLEARESAADIPHRDGR